MKEIPPLRHRRARLAAGMLSVLGLSIACLARAHAQSCEASSRRSADADYERGLAAYRDGRLDTAYASIALARAACPDVAAIRNDFIVAAVNAGHPADALAAAADLRPGDFPVYVLEALGRGARDLHEPDAALRFYDAILAVRVDVGAAVGRDLARLDRGEAAAAAADLNALNRANPGRIDVLEALGLADEAQGDSSAALAAVEHLLELAPDHAVGLALRYRLLVHSGAPQLATALTPERLVSPTQRAATLHDSLALEYRWARDAPGSDKERAAAIDAVIARMRAAAADETLPAEARAASRRDWISALAERGRAAEAVREYERLVAEGLSIPPYLDAAMVGAYLTVRQPALAVQRFESLPADYVPAFGVRVNEFYALLESERYAAAIAWADHLVAITPKFLDSDRPGLLRQNADYVSALVVAALARAYTNRPAEAQRALEALRRAAPANRDGLLGLAEVDALRGWPRRSAGLAGDVLQAEPDAVGPLPKVFTDQLATGDFIAADETANRMRTLLPADDPSLLHAQRDWQTHELPEFSIAGQYGRSYGGRPGIIDSGAEEYVYTPPVDWDYRFFVHLNQSEGTPVQGDTYRHAVGAGIEYRTDGWLATGELLEIDRQGPAPQVTLTAMPGDQWRIGAAYALRTLEIPIAAVVVGVHADRAALNLDYRIDESREFGGVASHEEFSDHNSRFETLGFWRERWVTGPVYQLDTRLDLDTSSNTLGATNYFNPRRDFTDEITLQNQWLQYRRYDRALTHELDAGLGDYWQENHGAGLVASLRYQLGYDINDRLTLKAGIGQTWRPYDGERERLAALTFNFFGRF